MEHSDTITRSTAAHHTITAQHTTQQSKAHPTIHITSHHIHCKHNRSSPPEHTHTHTHTHIHVCTSHGERDNGDASHHHRTRKRHWEIAPRHRPVHAGTTAGTAVETGSRRSCDNNAPQRVATQHSTMNNNTAQHTIAQHTTPSQHTITAHHHSTAHHAAKQSTPHHHITSIVNITRAIHTKLSAKHNHLVCWRWEGRARSSSRSRAGNWRGTFRPLTCPETRTPLRDGGR